jgi:hypothetical protein
MQCHAQNKIKQYDNDNNLLNEYVSISESSRKTSIARKLISLCLMEKTETGG